MKLSFSKKAFIFILLISIFSFPKPTKAQEKYHTEFLYGVTKATNSAMIGGAYARYGTRLKDNLFQTFGVEIVNIKDPLETRTTSFISGKSYIHSKVNYLYSLRLQYGRALILFNKAQYQGVQVAAVLSGGPSIGFQTPYYLEVTGPDSKNESMPASEYYNKGGASPVGPGGLLEGIPKSKIVLGLNVKAGLSFELGAFKQSVFGLEGGMMLEGFSQKIQLMNDKEGKRFFPNAFITLFYGNRR